MKKKHKNIPTKIQH